MPGTYSQLLVHCVFATRYRNEWIAPTLADRLYGYIGGIIRSESAILLCAGGMPDHVHLLVRWRPDMALSDLMRQVKSRSSRWIHESFADLSDFAWQEGYSVFSVSPSQEAAVRQYIATQAEHHTREDYKSELIRFLKAHAVDFNPQYVFD